MNLIKKIGSLFLVLLLVTGTLSINPIGTVYAASPTATIVVADTALVIGETSLVTITFSEAVTGFTNADLTIANGTLSAVSSSDGDITWTATLTPDADITDATNVITLDNTGVTDSAGNIGQGITSSNYYEIDTQRPTATIVVANNVPGIGQHLLVTIVFSEAVTGFDISDLSAANGTVSTVSGSGSIYSATLIPNANITAATNVITLDNTGVQDVSGNAGTGTTASNNYAIDTIRPTATIVVADSMLTAGATSQVTITFSEAVTGFNNADLTIPNGSLSAVSSSDGGITWTATFTPNINVNDTTNIISLSNSGVSDLAGNAGSGTTNSGNFTINTVRPTATIVFSDTALKIGDTSTVTITFSEAVSGFTNADLTIANGTISNVSSSDGGITWTATFTPTSNITYATNVITLDNTGVTDLAGNAGSGTTDSDHYAIDTVRPTATIVFSDTALKIGDISTVTITFSEAVSGFTNADLTIANGTISNVSSSDGGITWTATFTPTSNITYATNVITLDNTGVTDLAGNAGSGTTDSNNYAIDTVRPTATIVFSDTALKIGDISTVTITFSEAVSGFTNADLTIANGTISNVSSSDGGITWTATFTPANSITDATNLITLDNTGVADLAGNAGSGTTDSNNYAIDTVRPTATIVVSDSTLNSGETPLVTITFSEAVTGFTNADLSVPNGTLSAVSSSDGGITWTATFTPNAGITDTSNVITLSNTGVTDLVGNAGSGTTNSNNYTIDTVSPTATIIAADNALKIGETSLVTITFSEAVTGFTNADLTIANGTLSNVSSSDGGITWTATFTPTSSITDASNLITLDNSGVQNATGNKGSGTTDSNNYAIDTQRPTATIVVSDKALGIGETSLVTITFSEAVTGFTLVDLVVDNGTLSGLSTSDNVTWTATFLPVAGITDATNFITLNNSDVSDAAGNAGTGTTFSNNYAIDAQRPTATIVVTDSTLTAGETSLVTITFSEAVTGFDNADLSVANGTLSAVSSTDGGIIWTATFTPTEGVTDTSNLIVLNNIGVTDLAGNAGTGTTNSSNYSIATVRPTATIVVADSALKIGETSLVTITFSEAVTGFDNKDLTIANGTLSAVSSSDGGITWTATFTPTKNISDSTNVITLNNTGVQNAAGNTGLGTTDSNNYAIDTVVPAVVRPTATIVVADTALNIGETSLVTITFSEAVTGFTNADLTIVNGTLSAVSSKDGGVTWTATFTPQANINVAKNLITLNNSGVYNSGGNAGQGITESNQFSIFTQVITDGGGSIYIPNNESPSIPSDKVITSINGEITLSVGTSGVVSLGEIIRLSIPKGASSRELEISIEALKNIETLLRNKEILASQVFEIKKNSIENLNKPVTLTVAFDLESLKSDETVALFYYDELKKSWVKVDGGIIKGNQLTAEINQFSKYALLVVDKTTGMAIIDTTVEIDSNEPSEIPTEDTTVEFNFSDTIGHWAEEEIGAMFTLGIITGYQDGTFKPNDSIKREHVAVMITRALELKPIRAARTFTDVSTSSPYYDAISRLQVAGIIDGTNDAFHPQANMTRAQMAKVLVLALGLNSGSKTTFRDVPEDHWANGYIAALEEHGITIGDNGNFKPNDLVTRAQFSAFLCRALNLQK
ncbi:Ig-like domain-containing protein [Lysinibacillus contaminans]|uniref:Ig-like domain-containing protein n=1 Tax=Lysinibacillus contaminans TaxID=1293441 RepID=UPI0009EBD6D2|nr:Ig-like domain-containing protein [Lysinibacillus contaminans]